MAETKTPSRSDWTNCSRNIKDRVEKISEENKN